MVLPATSTIKWLGCKTLEHPQCPKTNGRSWPWSEEDDEKEAKNDKHKKFLQSDKCLVKSEWFKLDKSSHRSLWNNNVSDIIHGQGWLSVFNLHRSRRPVSLVCLKPRGFWQKLLPPANFPCQDSNQTGQMEPRWWKPPRWNFRQIRFPRKGAELAGGLFKPLFSICIWNILESFKL